MLNDPLLQPYQLKHLTLRNRIMTTSHEPAYAEDGHAEGALPRLSRRARQGRRRADDDGGLGRDIARQPAGVQQRARLQGRGGALAARTRRRLPRARRRGDDPAHPSRPAHALGQRRLAAGRLLFASSRGSASRLSEADRGLGHRAHRQGFRRCGGAHEGGRSRRHRARGLRPSAAISSGRRSPTTSKRPTAVRSTTG